MGSSAAECLQSCFGSGEIFQNYRDFVCSLRAPVNSFDSGLCDGGGFEAVWAVDLDHVTQASSSHRRPVREQRRRCDSSISVHVCVRVRAYVRVMDQAQT